MLLGQMTNWDCLRHGGDGAREELRGTSWIRRGGGLLHTVTRYPGSEERRTEGGKDKGTRAEEQLAAAVGQAREEEGVASLVHLLAEMENGTAALGDSLDVS